MPVDISGERWSLNEPTVKIVLDWTVLALNDPHLSNDVHMSKLAPKSLPLKDPGFDTALPDAPQTTSELIERMDEMVRAHRTHLAHQTALRAAFDQGREV